MAGPGFIHDKLEIKFLILYIAARVLEPVPFDTMLDLTLCDDAIDYFDFSDCLADLVRTEHLELTKEGLYKITEKGRRNSEICASSIPYSVRLRCDRNLLEWNRKLRRRRQVKTSTAGRRHGQRHGPPADGDSSGYGGGTFGPLSAISGTALQRDYQDAAG